MYIIIYNKMIMQIKEELQFLMKKKMDLVMFYLLQEVIDRVDFEIFNFQFEFKSFDVCFSIWGNFSKNFRFDILDIIYKV